MELTPVLMLIFLPLTITVTGPVPTMDLIALPMDTTTLMGTMVLMELVFMALAPTTEGGAADVVETGTNQEISS